MKYILFIIWLILTVILTFSIIGLIIVLRSNDTVYWKPEEENRSLWMKLGYNLLNSILTETRGKP